MTSRIPEMQAAVERERLELNLAVELTRKADYAYTVASNMSGAAAMECEVRTGGTTVYATPDEPEYHIIAGAIAARYNRLATELLGPPKPVEPPAIVFPDRRPVMVGNGFGSNYAEDPELGRRAELRTDDHVAAVDYIIKRLRDGYAYGYRRFMVNQLNGHPKDQQLLSMEQLGGMASERIDLLLERTSDWLAHHLDAMLIAYLGGWSDDSFGTNRLDPAIQAPATLTQMMEHTAPWRDLGPPHQIGFLFDNASKAEVMPFYDQWKAWLNERGHWCGMEALPVIDKLPDNDRLAREPVMVRDGHLESLEAAAPHEENSPTERWQFDPATTEVGIGIHRATTVEQVRAYIARGLVLFNYWTAGGTELDAAILGG